MFSKEDKNTNRLARHKRVRKNLAGTASCPRLCVYRSNAEIYGQIIDDVNGKTLCCASSRDKDILDALKGKNKKEQATLVGEKLGKLALSKEIKSIVFDRGGYLYTGRVQAFAEGARKAGLEF